MRPNKVIDKKLFEQYCQNIPTVKELANCFQVSESTMKRFAHREYGKDVSEVIRDFSAPTVVKLKNKLLEKALKGDNACLFFALKNFSNMSDNPKGELSQNNDALESFNKNIKLLQLNMQNPPPERSLEEFEEDEPNSTV